MLADVMVAILSSDDTTYLLTYLLTCLLTYLLAYLRARLLTERRLSYRAPPSHCTGQSTPR